MHSELTKTHMNLSKSQFYGSDGTGRDTYIALANGGFCPERKPTKIDDVSKYNKIYRLELTDMNGNPMA